jgi:hypothetical protein
MPRQRNKVRCEADRHTQRALVLQLLRDAPERHFGGQASALCVLNGESLDVRRSPETDAIDILRISRGGDRLVLFLGAGFSTSSKTDDDRPLAPGNDLRDRALQRLMHSAASGDELARRFLRSVSLSFTPIEHPSGRCYVRRDADDAQDLG